MLIQAIDPGEEGSYLTLPSGGIGSRNVKSEAVCFGPRGRALITQTERDSSQGTEW